MKKSQLSDKQLEEILGQMPKIKDHRDSRDIYSNIAHRVEKRKKMPAWVIPGAALAAVLFLAFILSPGLLGVNHSSEESMDRNAASENAKSSKEMDTAVSDDSASEKSSGEQDNTFMAESADGEQKEKADFAAMDQANPYGGLISLYPGEADIETSDIFTYAIPDDQAMAIVPVTITKPKKEGKPRVESYTETMAMLKEEEWGLTDYYPMDAAWNYDEAKKTLTMDVKQNNPYRDGSTGNITFIDSMTQNFSGAGIDKLILTTEGKPGLELSNIGLMDELPLNTETKKRRAYLFLTVEGVQNPYLVPTKEQHETIGEAFEQMWKGDEAGYLSPSLPDHFKLAQTELNDKVLEITLTDDTALDESFLPNLEAILMTASEFDYTGVQFTNANIDQLGPFNLTGVLPLPLAPNKKNID